MNNLEDLYREVILDHYRTPRNRGELETPPAQKAEGFNPLCGDEIVVYVDVDDVGTIRDIKIGGQGCSISQSSASMMSAAVKGKTVGEARRLMATFKAMMSIHEKEIGGDGSQIDMVDSDPPNATATTETDSTLSTDAVTKLGDLEALQGVVKFPVRIKCATLSWNTLSEAFDKAATT